MIRKDTKPRYHPRHKGLPGPQAAKPHNCLICRHVDKDEVERKYLEGWLISDIRRAHPWIRGHSAIQEHMEIVGGKDELAKRRAIDSKKILERIVRAGYPVLESGKVYPRDMIDAIKALHELAGKERTGEIWRLLEVRRETYGSRKTDTSETEKESRI